MEVIFFSVPRQRSTRKNSARTRSVKAMLEIFENIMASKPASTFIFYSPGDHDIINLLTVRGAAWSGPGPGGADTL